ncbi:MAG: GNAT family N-acetyltransferase [candidate division WOR-3 bacterium]
MGKFLIEITNLTPKNLKDAPEWDNHPFSCQYCIYWEFPEECVDPRKEKKEEMREKKLNWLKETRRVFGNCGMIAYLNKKPVGYAQYAPPEFLPRAFNYSIKPSEDAVLLSCLFIPQKEFRRLGIGSKILKRIIADLEKRKVKALEAFARKGKEENPSGPVAFYLRNGFRICKDDKEFPLLRLDL